MSVYVEDPNPGRCLNHRSGPNGTQLRCLDYESVPHVCTFPSVNGTLAAAHHYTSTFTDNTKPLPWVKPGETTT